MTTSSLARISSNPQVRGMLDQIRSLSPRSTGIIALSLAVLMTLATYLLYTSLAYPSILLDPATNAQAIVAHAAGGGVIGFLSLLFSGGLVVALSINLAPDLAQPAQRHIFRTGGAAGVLWAVGALLGLLLMPLWGHAPTGLSQTLAVLDLIMAEIAAPLLLALWTIALSRHLQAFSVLGWISAIGLLLGVTRSLLWCFNALLPEASGFYGVADILTVLSVLGASFWLLWPLRLSLRLLTQRTSAGTPAPKGAQTTESNGTMPRRMLVRGALGLGIGLAGTAFFLGRTGFMFGAEPELEGDDIPTEPSLIASGFYLIAWIFLKIHPQNSVTALVQNTPSSDLTPPPPAAVLAQLGVEETIEQITVNGVPAERISAPGVSSNRWLLYIHGGGWAVPATNGHRAFVGRLSKALDATVLMPNYHLIPEHPFPAALNDCVAAYRWLRQQGVPASHIVIAGESAGANLTLTTALALRDNGDELPAVLVAISPPTDMAMTGETYRTKAWADPQGNLLAQDVFPIYTNHGTTSLRNPLVSPFYADVRGFPPTMILAGTEEIFLSDATRMADKLKAAGVTTKIEVWPGQVHAFAAGPSIIPEARLATQHITTFIRKYLQG